MRGRTGTPQRRNDRTPSYLLLVALVFAGKLPFFFIEIMNRANNFCIHFISLTTNYLKLANKFNSLPKVVYNFQCWIAVQFNSIHLFFSTNKSK